MRRFLSALLIMFTMFNVGCDSVNDLFGCSRDEGRRNIDLKLGTPGETNVDNQLPANDNVKALDKEEVITFETDEGQATITHRTDRTINEGDIIVANPDQQYLLKVRKVIERRDGSTQVLFRQSRIQDVVGDKSGALSFESTPVYELKDIDELNRRAKAANEPTVYEVDEKGRIYIRNLELFSIDINSEGKISAGANKILGIPVKNPYEKFTITSAAGGRYKAVVNEARIEVIPTIRSKADWEFGKISDLRTRLDTRVKYRVDLTYEMAGLIQMEAMLDAFMPKKVIPVRVPGTPPVYLDIELGIPAGVLLKAAHEGKTRIIYESEYEFYSVMSYDKENGIQTAKDQKVVIKDKKIEVKNGTTKVEAELFLKPQVTARLYRVVGPYGYLKPYVRGEIEWPSTQKKDDLFVGVAGGVGIELSEPIFLTSITGYDSGNIFDFFASFDLDGAGAAGFEPLKISPKVKPGVTVDKIGPEGFVVFNLKEHREGEFLKYELINSTKNGLMVPSETFYMDGMLYYYPLPGAEQDQFKVRIISNSGRAEEVSITVASTPEVLQEVSKERFGITNNSYKVSSGTPGEFKDQVPSHQLGGGGVGIQGMEGIALECNFFDSPQNNDILTHYFKMNCQQAMVLREKHRDFLVDVASTKIDIEEAHKNERDPFYERLSKISGQLTKFENINYVEDKGVLEFNFYNLAHFRDFMTYTKRNAVPCQPKVIIEKIEEKDFLGFRLGINECEGLETNYILQNPHSFKNWNVGKAGKDGRNKTLEYRISKEVLDKYHTNNFNQRFSLVFPLSERLYAIQLMDYRRGKRNFYGSNNPLDMHHLPDQSSLTFDFNVSIKEVLVEKNHEKVIQIKPLSNRFHPRQLFQMFQ